MLVPKYMPKPLHVHLNAISDLCQPVGGSYVNPAGQWAGNQF